MYVGISVPVAQEYALISARPQFGKGHLAEQHIIQAGAICLAYAQKRHRAPSLIIHLMNGRASDGCVAIYLHVTVLMVRAGDHVSSRAFGV